MLHGLAFGFMVYLIARFIAGLVEEEGRKQREQDWRFQAGQEAARSGTETRWD